LGPVGHNARRVLKLLQDPERTGLVVVAIPEEMAVVEALEFHRQAVDELRVEPAAAVLNGCHERRFTRQEAEEILRLASAEAGGTLERGVPLAAALRAGRRQVRRHRLTRLYQGRLRRGLPVPVASLPFLFRESLGPDDIKILAARLEAA
jgi:anion-transporting  ArsA/GET3 family ATPase